MFGYSDSLARSTSINYGLRESCLNQSNSRSQRRLTGWRKGLIVSACTAALVLLLNFSVTIWAVTNLTAEEGIGTIFTGSCRRTTNWARWLHVAINLISTILLAASNYCMQCLSSPTRAEVDKAHSRHVWLDIGVPSVRNLPRVKWSRIVLWLLLGLSSAPLHLM